ncbi:MAG: HNH endonuclease signature motif containing protein [Ignavibacteriae bacterium]|nr:HNH endonuclease signature motif containing protein [Ignavibacteriota bacterium]
MKFFIRFIILLIVSVSLFSPIDSNAQKKSKKNSNSYGTTSYTKKSTKKKSSDYNIYKVKAPKEKKSTTTTYYDYGKTYKTTGYTKVKRNSSAKKEFLKKNGYKKVPPGYQVDHIKPLSEGGTDTPDNMQLIPTSVHKEKTTTEKHKHKKSFKKKKKY